jgi:hypothetical protein
MLKPIDLQTLFTHLNNVGKTQSAAEQSIHAQQAVQGDEIAKKSELEETTVDSNNQIEQEENSVDEDGRGARKYQSRTKMSQEEQKKKKKMSFRDPDLGSHIDLEG